MTPEKPKRTICWKIFGKRQILDGNCGKLQPSDKFSNVELSLKRGKMDRDLGSVSFTHHDKRKICLKKRKNRHEHLAKEKHEQPTANMQLGTQCLRLRLRWTEQVGKGSILMLK